MLTKKNLVLCGINEKEKKAVVTMQCNGEMTSGIVRLYNFSQEPRGIISLGIYADKSVIKAGLTKTGLMTFSFLTELNKIPETFSCAVVNLVGGEITPLLYGGVDEGITNSEVFDKVISSLSRTKNMNEVEQTLDDFGVDYEDKEKTEIESLIDKEMMKNDEMCEKECDNCFYKKYYLSIEEDLDEDSLTNKTLSVKGQEEKQENKSGENKENNCLYNEEIGLCNDEKIEDSIEEKEKNFFSQLKEQIEEVFHNGEEETYLAQLIPNSNWVKVKTEGSDYYVLGLIKEDEEIKYICYGVPGIYQSNPPRFLAGYPVWFPIDINKPQGFGYWLSYQDAESGESVKAMIV